MSRSCGQSHLNRDPHCSVPLPEFVVPSFYLGSVNEIDVVPCTVPRSIHHGIGFTQHLIGQGFRIPSAFSHQPSAISKASAGALKNGSATVYLHAQPRISLLGSDDLTRFSAQKAMTRIQEDDLRISACPAFTRRARQCPPSPRRTPNVSAVLPSRYQRLILGHSTHLSLGMHPLALQPSLGRAWTSLLLEKTPPIVAYLATIASLDNPKFNQWHSIFNTKIFDATSCYCIPPAQTVALTQLSLQAARNSANTPS